MKKKTTKNLPGSFTGNPDIQMMKMLSNMEDGEILSAINILLRILQSRGLKLHDWENKKRTLKEIRPIYKRIYFFASEPEPERRETQ